MLTLKLLLCYWRVRRVNFRPPSTLFSGFAIYRTHTLILYTKPANFIRSSRRFAIVLVSAYLMFSAANASAEPLVGSDKHERVVKKRLERIAKKYDLPSVDVVISQKDRLTKRSYHHPDVEPQGIYGLGSATKMLAATLLLSHYEKSAVGLDAPLLPHINTELLRQIPQLGELSLVNLLRHESGLSDYANNPEWMANVVLGNAPKSVKEKMKSVQIDKKLSGSFSYSNSNYVVLESVFESLSEQEAFTEFNDFYRSTEVSVSIPLEPPSLEAYFANAKGQSNDVSSLEEHYGFDGGAYATPEALNALLRKLFADGSVLKPASLQAMHDWRSMAPQTIPIGDGVITHYGLGVMKLQYRGSTLIGHMGGTLKYQSFAFYDRDNDLAFVLMTNSAGRHYSNAFFQELVPKILDIHYRH